MKALPTFEREPLEPLLKALAHPVRAQVLAVLTGRDASAAELAEMIGEPASKIRYHLRSLAESGLIGCDRIEHRRGAREQIWIAKTPQVIGDEQLPDLSPEQMRLLDLYCLRLIFGDASAGVREGAFARRLDHYLTRFRPLVDEQGWKELVEVFHAAFVGIERVNRRASERLAQSGEEPVLVSASLLLFDLEAPARGLPGLGLPLE